MNAEMKQSNRLPIFSISAVISTTLLMTIGSIVRVTGNSLGCPDWPLCYGQPIPPIFYQSAWFEFAHRIAALAAGSQIALVLFIAWRHHRHDKWIYRPALTANILLVAQIILGGIHVILRIPPITGLMHTANAMLIVGLMAVVLTVSLIQNDLPIRAATTLGNRTFTLCVSIITAALYLIILSGSYSIGGDVSTDCTSTDSCASAMSTVRNIAIVTSVLCIAATLGNTLLAVPALECNAVDLMRDKFFVNCVSWTTVATYLLMLTGSYVTRSGASLVCPGFPLCGPTTNAMGRLMDIQLLHRYTSYVVAGLILVIVLWILNQSTDHNVRRLAQSLIILLLLQISLGASNIMLKLPMWSRSLHLMVGTYLWIVIIILWATVTLGRVSASRLRT